MMRRRSGGIRDFPISAQPENINNNNNNNNDDEEVRGGEEIQDPNTTNRVAAAASDAGVVNVGRLSRANYHRINNNNSRFQGGFSTSICDLFNDPSRRADCCSIIFCGVLASDRTQHLLEKTGAVPVSEPIQWRKRFMINFLPFLSVFIIFALVPSLLLPPDQQTADDLTNSNNNNNNSQQQRDSLEIALKVSGWYFIFLLIRASKIRSERRQQIIQILHQLDHPSVQTTTTTFETAMRLRLLTVMHEQHVHHAHFLFGFSENDRLNPTSSSSSSNDDDDDDDDENNESDICNCMFQCLSFLCFGASCGVWLQTCGICALAQEAREIDSLVDKELRFIDYVTLQPFAEYVPTIENLRLTQNESFGAHYRSISKLSKLLVKFFMIIILFAFIFGLTNINQHFNIEKMSFFMLTFVQAFLVLYFIHWRWHKFDLSFDAVIKYFSCGFLVCGHIQFLIENISGNIICKIAQIFENHEFEEDISQQKVSSYFYYVTRNKGPFLAKAFAKSCVAGMSTGLVLYFGYWMLEHPDLMPEVRMSRIGFSSSASSSNNAGSEDNLTSLLTKNNNNDDGGGGRIAPRMDPVSLGAGTTIAMACVGVGIASSDALNYVLFLNEKGAANEFRYLFLTSILPIFPILGAIQSIGVCQRDIEHDTSIKLGRSILLPAFLLNVIYIFSVQGLQTLSIIQEEIGSIPTKDEHMFSKVELPPMGLCSLVTFFGGLYYFVMARAQCSRLSRLQSVGGSAVDGQGLLV